MNDVRTPLLRSRWFVVASLALAIAPACGSLTPGNPDTSPDTDDPGTIGDETMDTPTGGGIQDATIYDIQQGKIAVESLVSVKSVVAVADMYIDGKDRGYIYVSEQGGGEYSGIQVFVNPTLVAALATEGKSPVAGDVLDLTATYTEFFETSQLTLQNESELTITGTAAIPAPDAVSAADLAGAKAENYESCLVSVNGAKVTAPVADFGEFQVDDVLQVDDLFFLPAGGPEPPMGTEFSALVGVLTYSFEVWKLAPRTCADFMGWADCEVIDPTSDTNPDCMEQAGEYTIFQLQQDAVCPGTGMITVTGAVVTSGLTFKKDGFYIQDPMGGEYSGIFVFIGADNPNMIVTNPGDIVTVTGTYDDFFGAAQIEVAGAADVMVTGTTAVPTPEVVSTADITTEGPKAEAYEGVLVQVNDVAAVADLDDHNEWSVDDDLRIDDLFFAMADWTIPAPGTEYTSIAGPLAFTFANTKIVPRNADDLQPAP
jgi:hypothetical protein